MKKSIMLLINGFGIEKKDSVEIYSASLMPALDSLTKKYIFGSLEAPVSDYNNGYRLFSISQEKTIEQDVVDKAIEDKSISNIDGMKKLQAELPSGNKIHIFYVVESGRKLMQVRDLLHLINPLKDKTVYLHIVFSSSDVNGYDEIERILSKLAFELGEYSKLGIIVGKDKLNDENIDKTVLGKYGEHWGEYAKKIEILKRDVVTPNEVSAFFINSGFEFSNQDRVLFLNYSQVDFTSILNVLSVNNAELYSLFEMQGCSNLFERGESSVDCFNSKLLKINKKVLFLTDKEKINDINYYLNGMQTRIIPNVTYAVRNLDFLKDKESLSKIFNDSYDGLIIDFNIGNLTKVDEIKDNLKDIDSIIKPLEEFSLENGILFMISSLFGMHAIVMDGAMQKTVNFSGRVPCIVVSKDYLKSNYSISDKDTYDLSTAFLSSISDTQIGSGIIHKKSFLEQLLKR